MRQARVIQRKLPLPTPLEVCYHCGGTIDTEKDVGFSSTIRFGKPRKYFHLSCAGKDDPTSIEEVQWEEDKYG